MQWDFLDTLGIVIIPKLDDVGNAGYYKVLNRDADVVGYIFDPHVDFDDMSPNEVREYIKDEVDWRC